MVRYHRTPTGTRFNVAAVVYGHLHIPRTIVYDGLRFVDVSIGYPREWQRRPAPPRIPRKIPRCHLLWAAGDDRADSPAAGGRRKKRSPTRPT